MNLLTPLLQLLVGAAVGGAAGYLGSFMILKRMSLVGDALSHVALPGLAIGIAIGISPMIGAFVALMIAIVGIWYVGETTDVFPDALVGVFFTASLAIGILLTPEPDLLEALFGDIQKISTSESLVAVIAAILVLAATKRMAKRLILGTVSPELAKSTGIDTRRDNLIYLFLVGTVVALGIRFVGSLLMGALVIIPAASAKNVSVGMRRYQLLSALFGVASAVVGIMISSVTSIQSGPAVVLTSTVLFVLTYMFRSPLLSNPEQT